MDDFGNSLEMYYQAQEDYSNWNTLTQRWYVSTATYGGSCVDTDCADI